MQGFDVFDIGGYQLREARFPSDLIHVETDFRRLCLDAVQARYCPVKPLFLPDINVQFQGVEMTNSRQYRHT